MFLHAVLKVELGNWMQLYRKKCIIPFFWSWYVLTMKATEMLLRLLCVKMGWKRSSDHWDENWEIPQREKRKKSSFTWVNFFEALVLLASFQNMANYLHDWPLSFRLDFFVPRYFVPNRKVKGLIPLFDSLKS